MVFMGKHVITGGPGTGKTTLIQALKEQGEDTLPEASRIIIAQQREGTKGKHACKGAYPWQDPGRFQELVIKRQAIDEQTIKPNDRSFLDRSIIDSIAYLHINNINPTREQLWLAHTSHYDTIFLLEPLPGYRKDKDRRESKKEAKRIHDTIAQTYQRFGYQAVDVPATTLDERVGIVLGHLDEEETFGLIKPEATPTIAADIEQRILDAGLSIRRKRTIRMDYEQFEHLYGQTKWSLPDIYEDMRPYFLGNEVTALHISGKDAVQKLLKLRGASNPSYAKKGTIRGDYAKDQDYRKLRTFSKNMFHAADTEQEAKKDLETFFRGVHHG